MSVLSSAKRAAKRVIPAKIVVGIQYRRTFGRWPNLSDPQKYTEKCQWSKLHEMRSTRYTRLVDKHTARDYVREMIGEDYLVPIVGAWERFDDIDFDTLPSQFVLKCNHDSGSVPVWKGHGSVLVCRDKSKFDVGVAREILDRALKRNFADEGVELQYKDIAPRLILAEQFLGASSGEIPADYKFFCFNGEPAFVKVVTGRGRDLRANFYDMNWSPQPFTIDLDASDQPLPRPENFEEMVRVARTLSQEFSHVRVDLYSVEGRIYFGEFMFNPSAGMGRFNPSYWDDVFGTMWDLSTDGSRGHRAGD